MTCEDIIPSTTLGAGAGAAVKVVTGGFDWVAVIASPTVVAASFVQIMPDSGGNFRGGTLTPIAGGTCLFMFGGAGGTINQGADPVMSAVPFVPNQFILNLTVVALNVWTYAIIGGYNE